ncbi:MAG: hypothetical protein A3A43_01930 [Candidatus Liptonbacteria bacterium RIFCSPLOWO2_01_FULL_56_20]|uniref:DUF378 domain-containing protein n=1 Tax=Candidatus Liptonbacteria bacterium RIFCSPLOWO2_01_FULL_56_20 TaxID=1798652 RepID=A0A1G2CJU5_9BACT|nr:MAG: hypothetical protein UY96_C0006G0019 [Parcubacteria group bacterium GW2011_GWB1_56_8]OGY98393.1 MAG: hypothetical protein A2681_01785 [Candidatus Liptonbacteria bacterium RIFCSPHIGHO2_01_FULL_56_18b]OGZ01527.1 MAG: hypothetical protein A3A43_01930 [Candidatus Liptonbacteria bacterium RIFCSPLOWO2_01_FULL_56_20]
MKGMHKVAFILLVIGGLNWLLQGVFGWDIGTYLGGMASGISRTIYVLVGLAAVYELVSHKGRCKECEGRSGM